MSLECQGHATGQCTFSTLRQIFFSPVPFFLMLHAMNISCLGALELLALMLVLGACWLEKPSVVFLPWRLHGWWVLLDSHLLGSLFPQASYSHACFLANPRSSFLDSSSGLSETACTHRRAWATWVPLQLVGTAWLPVHLPLKSHFRAPWNLCRKVLWAAWGKLDEKQDMTSYGCPACTSSKGCVVWRNAHQGGKVLLFGLHQGVFPSVHFTVHVFL